MAAEACIPKGWIIKRLTISVCARPLCRSINDHAVRVAKRFANGTQALTIFPFLSPRVNWCRCWAQRLRQVYRTQIGGGSSDARRRPNSYPDGEIGFVFQEPTLMPWADSLTNARLPLDLKRIPRGQANDRGRPRWRVSGWQVLNAPILANCPAA